MPAEPRGEQSQIAKFIGCAQARAQRRDLLRVQIGHQRGPAHRSRGAKVGGYSERGEGRARATGRRRASGCGVGIEGCKIELRRQFRQHHRQRAAVGQYFKKTRRAGFSERAFEFAPHALAHQRTGFASAHHAAHERSCFRSEREAERREAGRKARGTQDAHRIFDEGVGHMA